MLLVNGLRLCKGCVVFKPICIIDSCPLYDIRNYFWMLRTSINGVCMCTAIHSVWQVWVNSVSIVIIWKSLSEILTLCECVKNNAPSSRYRVGKFWFKNTFSITNNTCKNGENTHKCSMLTSTVVFIQCSRTSMLVLNLIIKNTQIWLSNI